MRAGVITIMILLTQGLVPNAEEMVVIANLTDAQLDIFAENESLALSDEFLNPPTPDFSEILPFRRRRRRQAEEMNTFTNELILVALENENACNPILRTSARSILEFMQE